jgi:hypothetical protein
MILPAETPVGVLGLLSPFSGFLVALVGLCRLSNAIFRRKNEHADEHTNDRIE